MSCFLNSCFVISESPTWVIPKKFQKDECSNEPASNVRRDAGFLQEEGGSARGVQDTHDTQPGRAVRRAQLQRVRD